MNAPHWPHADRIVALAAALRTTLADHDRKSAARLEAAGAVLAVFARDYRKLLADPRRFNAFEVLALQNREYVHSNVLAWLLDPHANHGLGAAFLNRALTAAALPAWQPSDRCAVHREVSGEESIVDVEVSTDRALLYIENKVRSSEGAAQTHREHRDLAAAAAGRPARGVFLTLTGTRPENEAFLAWSYTTIADMIAAVMAEDNVAQNVAWFLNEYLAAVRLHLIET